MVVAVSGMLLAACAQAEPGVARPTGGVWSDVQGRWWGWASVPEARNPVADRTGEFCGEGQPDDVWFVAGTFGGAVERTCEVPAGRPLVGPVVNRIGTSGECALFMADAKGQVSLDGVPVVPHEVGAVKTVVRAGADNSWDLRAGESRVTACGLWLWVPPLSPGRHELRFEGSTGKFHVAAVYRLKVVGERA
ncbi:hypothetical protein GCM10022243_29500 [Saccharothrix violaceirubra]